MVGLVAPAYELVHPSFVHPEIIMPIQQSSGAFSLLAGGDPEVRLGTDDLAVYIKVLDVRTKETVSQATGNQMQSISISAKMISTPTYTIRLRDVFDHHDAAAAGNWGFGLPEALRLGHHQGTWQQMRNGLLYGFNPGNGEGLLNATGVTAVPLPADQFGNTTVLTYDNGAMAFFLAQQVGAIKTRMMQLGNKGSNVRIVGPQRTLEPFEYNVVQLVQMQREGAGSLSTKGTLQEILSMNQDSLEWTYDDTLIGQGQNGHDAVFIVIPEIDAMTANEIDTNAFAKLRPNMKANTLMLCDMPAPREIISPMAGGATDMLSELRTSPGWAVRPEGVTVVSMQYS